MIAISGAPVPRVTCHVPAADLFLPDNLSACHLHVSAITRGGTRQFTVKTPVDGRWIDGLSLTSITSSGCSGDWRWNFPQLADETWTNRFVSSHICTKVSSVYPCIRVSKKMLGSGIQIVGLSRCNLLSKTLSGAELRSWYRNLCRVPGDQFTNNSSPPPLLDTAALMWWNFNGNNLGVEEEIGGISSPETLLWPQQMCPVFIDKSLCVAGAGCRPHAPLVHHTQSPWPPPPGGWRGTLLFWN